MYRFTGIFARPIIKRPSRLPTGAEWRDIARPFAGIGVCLPALAGSKPGQDEARRMLAEVGLSSAVDWLFIDYVTWGGPIDSVYGLGASGGLEFGPFAESDGDNTQATYLELMNKFGVAEADALKFPPFVRGFWGE